MYTQAYQDVVEDDQIDARQGEWAVIENTIQLMEHSDANSDDMMLRIKALHMTLQVWTHLINDLSMPENGMSAELKASIISIGIFILKYLENMRSEKLLTFAPIIEISCSIQKGLK